MSCLLNNTFSCKAFVYPSLYEGFGLPVLEALILRLSCIDFPRTVMQEIAGDCALYFDHNDPKDIARIIEGVFQKRLIEIFICGTRNGVLENYSWEKSAKSLVDVF